MKKTKKTVISLSMKSMESNCNFMESKKKTLKKIILLENKIEKLKKKNSDKALQNYEVPDNFGFDWSIK